MTEIKVGIGVPRGVLAPDRTPQQRMATLDAVALAGLDHVGLGDHVSFFVGVGFDALIQASSLLALHPILEVYTAVYLLPLRHPVLVARQLATISEMAPGRLVFGVGVGGEDPHEVEVCGVDPRTRGRRMDESLEILRGLAAGEPVTFDGEHFQLDQALIVPAPSPPVPIVVGGRSTAAVRRAARFGDGWIGIWVSERRFASVVGEIEELAAEGGRVDTAWEHAMYVWCGFDDDEGAAGERLARSMEGFYRIPFSNFAKYSPAGSPERVAEFLAPYVAAGCRRIHLSAVAGSDDELIAAAGEVKRLLVS
jgi:alkanesulfonate monooxygenase SsuD/methylene tetrahydromethanopterin reductase-like flavin-dependent oxidoreductase (luciferase family)